MPETEQPGSEGSTGHIVRSYSTIRSVNQGPDAGSSSNNSWFQVDPWQSAQLPSAPPQMSAAQAWAGYQPDELRYPLGRPTVYGPTRTNTPSPVPSDNVSSRLPAWLNSFVQASSRSREPQGHVQESLEPPVHHPPMPEVQYQVLNPSPVYQHPFPVGPQQIQFTTPAPEIPPWIHFPGMEFLHGVQYANPEFISPYGSHAEHSDLDSTTQRQIVAFYDVGRMYTARQSERDSVQSGVGTVESDQLRRNEIHRWYEVAQGLHQRASRAREREREDSRPEAHQVPLPEEDGDELETCHNPWSRSQSVHSQHSNHSHHLGAYDGRPDQCSICQDLYRGGEDLVRLVCRHTFHTECWDQHIVHHDLEAVCPNCRGGGTVLSHFTFPHESSQGPTYPWWPVPEVESEVFHSSTQLEGHQSILVDPGAYTNLVGSEWAARQAQVAKDAGRTSYKVRMEQSMNIKGVGHGSQQCIEMASIPVSVPRADDHDRKDETEPHGFVFQAPTVEGEGSGLPALLGLRSMAARGAILSMAPGKECLSFPGPGKYEIGFAPGSVHIPLQKAPSGHLCFRSDFFSAQTQTDPEVFQALLEQYRSPSAGRSDTPPPRVASPSPAASRASGKSASSIGSVGPSSTKQLPVAPVPTVAAPSPSAEALAKGTMTPPAAFTGETGRPPMTYEAARMSFPEAKMPETPPQAFVSTSPEPTRAPAVATTRIPLMATTTASHPRTTTSHVVASPTSPATSTASAVPIRNTSPPSGCPATVRAAPDLSPPPIRVPPATMRHAAQSAPTSPTPVLAPRTPPKVTTSSRAVPVRTVKADLQPPPKSTNWHSWLYEDEEAPKASAEAETGEPRRRQPRVVPSPPPRGSVGQALASTASSSAAPRSDTHDPKVGPKAPGMIGGLTVAAAAYDALTKQQGAGPIPKAGYGPVAKPKPATPYSLVTRSTRRPPPPAPAPAGESAEEYEVESDGAK